MDGSEILDQFHSQNNATEKARRARGRKQNVHLPRKEQIPALQCCVTRLGTRNVSDACPATSTVCSVVCNVVAATDGSLPHRFVTLHRTPDRTPDAAVHSWPQGEGTAQPESPEKVLTGDGAQSQTGIPTEPGLNNIFRLLDSEISRGQGGGLPFFIPNTTRPRPQGGKSESEPHVIVNSLSLTHTHTLPDLPFLMRRPRTK